MLAAARERRLYLRLHLQMPGAPSSAPGVGGDGLFQVPYDVLLVAVGGAHCCSLCCCVQGMCSAAFAACTAESILQATA